MDETLSSAVHQNLDTTYVNLAALLRYLRQREFTGRVHVQLVEYEAEVYLNGAEAPRVREIDHASGREAEGEEALQRLLVRASEPGGLVSVFTGEEESENGARTSSLVAESGAEGDAELLPEAQEWQNLLRVSGELIAAIERAALSAGADFDALFRAARLELSDDYSFLDPLTESFEYTTGGQVSLHVWPSPDAYVASICECLRRVTAKIATGARAARVRERIALELAVLARRRQTQLSRFKFLQQLDRIAGTKVL